MKTLTFKEGRGDVLRVNGFLLPKNQPVELEDADADKVLKVTNDKKSVTVEVSDKPEDDTDLAFNVDEYGDEY